MDGKVEEKQAEERKSRKVNVSERLGRWKVAGRAKYLRTKRKRKPIKNSGQIQMLQKRKLGATILSECDDYHYKKKNRSFLIKKNKESTM